MTFFHREDSILSRGQDASHLNIDIEKSGLIQALWY